MRLNEIQTRFKDMMFDHPAALDAPDEDFTEIFASGDIALPERLKVYRNNVMGTLTNAVTANFPLVEKLVGAEFLARMARAYILANPPKGGCLTFYADDFDDFISTFAPAAHLPWLADMAKLEILINRAYHAPDDTAMHAEDLAAIAPNELELFPLRLRASTYILKSRWPLGKIREFCLRGGSVGPDVHSGGVCLLVHRPHLDTEVTTISEGEYEFLGHLKTKKLGSAFADTLQSHPFFDFAVSLPRLMSCQIFLKE